MISVLFLLLSLISLSHETCHISANDCQVEYGPWSTCDPCKKVQSRHLNITKPPQSDGMPCPTNLIEHESCTPLTVCPQSLPCYGQFDCGMGDRCINDSLVCNGDNDCGNNHDEMNCTSTLYSRAVQKCLDMPTLPYLDHLGAGVHFATGELAGRTLDHQVFNGLCRQAYDEDRSKVYRMPYNVDNFRFRVVASDDLTVKTYNSLKQYTDDLDKSKTTKIDTSASVSGGFFGAKFRSYSDFFDQFGTTYLKSGTLGGRYSHVYVYSQADMSKDDQTTTSVASDLKISVSASIGFGMWKAKASYSHETDQSQSDSINNAFSTESTASHKIVHILGGTTTGAAQLGSGDLVNNASFVASNYEAWVSGVRNNPVILTKSLRPICQLILYSRVQNTSQKHEICLQALQNYLQPYLPSACRDCKNGGKKLNIAGQCQCVCGEGLGGDLCASNWNIPHSSNARSLYDLNVRSLSSDTNQDIKLITDANHRAISPPFLTKKRVGFYDDILKMQEERLFLMQSDQGIVQMRPSVQGYINITELDEYLKVIESTQIDFTSLTGCTDPNTLFCEVHDFDRDTHGYFVIAVKASQFVDNSAVEVYHVYRLDTTGRAVVFIEDPCDIMTTPITAVGAQIHVTTTCDDTIVVSCPMAPATIKVFNNNGEPQDLSQFQNYTAITGLQYFNNSIWFHTKTHQVAAFNAYTWRQTYSYNVGGQGSHVLSLSNTNLYVDFVGNLLLGQYANDGLAEGTPKFTIIESTDKEVLVNGIMPAFDECPYVTTYRGKLYLLCQRTEQSLKNILVFDYLK